jgi:hypothetical protein
MEFFRLIYSRMKLRRLFPTHSVVSWMTGRVMTELFRDKNLSDLATRGDTITAETNLPEGRYRVVLQRSWVGESSYIDFARASRPIQ